MSITDASSSAALLPANNKVEPISSVSSGATALKNASSGAPAGGVAPTARFDHYDRPELLSPIEVSRKYPHRYLGVHEPTVEEFLGRPTLFELHTSWYLFRAFLSIFDWTSFFVWCVGIGAVTLCMARKWYSDMPLTLLAAALVFPISFTISYGVSRRERTLLDVASLKASLVALYQLHREWQYAFPHSHRQYANDLRAVFATLVEDMALFIEHRGGKERIYRIYQSFDVISRMHEELRREDEWVKSVLSRAYQYERYMINDFERIRVTHDYRTPGTLRSYSFVFLYLFPVLLAPLFAYYGHLYGIWSGLFTSLLSSFMVTALYRVQANLEDPFDEIGSDDISMGILRETFIHMLP